MIDLTLLRLCRDRSEYNKLRHLIPQVHLDRETIVFIQNIDAYYKNYETADTIDISLFASQLEQRVFPALTEDTKLVYKGVLKQMFSSKPDEFVKAGFIQNLLTYSTVSKLGEAVKSYVDNEDIDIIPTIKSIISEFDSKATKSNIPKYVENIDSFLLDTDSDAGLRWGIPCLDKAMRPLRGGDFGIIGARPDMGKTSFVACIISEMVKHLGDNGSIEWFNNEGLATNILPRVMQTVLKCTVDELANKARAGTLYPEFNKAIGGEGRIRIRDCHGFTVWQLENIIKTTKPTLVIYDMLSNFKGTTGDRRDLEVEAIFQWGREMAAIHNHAGIATCQISFEGADKEYPPMSALKESKTGVQGACEFVILLGSIDDPTYCDHRWISTPKNKATRRLNASEVRQSVLFNKDYATFTEV